MVKNEGNRFWANWLVCVLVLKVNLCHSNWPTNNICSNRRKYLLFRWYFGKIKRIEAEKKLLLPDNEHGAFLVRDSESRRNDYSLSGTFFHILLFFPYPGPQSIRMPFQDWLFCNLRWPFFLSQNERGRWRITQLTALDWTRFPLNFPWVVRVSCVNYFF